MQDVFEALVITFGLLLACGLLSVILVNQNDDDDDPDFPASGMACI